MRIRTARADELGAVLQLLGDAFADEPEVVDLVRDLASDECFIPELSLVATGGDSILGHVLFTRAYVESSRADVPVLSLAPLAVTPAEQNRGIGSALVLGGLERARELGESAVLVLGHPGYYPRFGFAPALPRGITPPHPIEMPEAWMALELVPGALEGVEGPVRFGTPLHDPRYW
jgi:predicted N-acetyltransferase YhbS